jgi:hypothetical protein|uniref:hypothetical protein n=1 Tax=Fluviicola sp. TaxID=1917219 RepID=UPI004049E278
MKKRLLSFPLLLSVLFAFTSSSRSIIKQQFPFLVGRYSLIQVVDSEGAKPRKEFPDKYTLEIKSNDDFVLYKNAKRIKRLHFINMRSPLEQQENYVLFLDKEDNYPLYFYGDTIQQFYWPYSFSDNYFKKVK